MPTYNYAFSGGANGSQGWGDRWNIIFGGTFASGDIWTLETTSTSGDFTLGVGRLTTLNYITNPAVLNSGSLMTYRDRVYVGLGARFNFSDNGTPTEFQEQGPGAGFVDYLSQYGSQDTIYALGQIQGRLAVLARRSVQLWSVDADPNLFQLVQTIDNSGTQFPRSVQQKGDLDLYYLDDTGVRSLKTKETTLNAYTDDIGSPIDDVLQTVLQGLNAITRATVCSVVEPLTKNYWLHINGTIYVLATHPASKVIAWSTFEPRGNDNVLFTPNYFVVYNGIVYCRSKERGHYVYGGAAGSTYDQYSQVTFQLPWLDDKKPGTNKMMQGLGTIMTGRWALSIATDPPSGTFVAVLTNGSAATPNVLTDSTYDIGRFPIDMQGTHFALKGVSASTSTTKPVVFSSLILYYNQAEVQ